MAQATDRAIDLYLEDVKALIIGSYNALGIRASGFFGATLTVINQMIVMVGYGKFIGKNTGVRVFPLLQPILDWMRSKGVRPRGDNTARQTAFLIARKIAELGTEIFRGRGGIPYREIEERALNEHFDNIADAMQIDTLRDAGFQKL